MSKQTVCVDFDGVIHSYRSPWQGAEVIPDPPTDGAFAFLAGAVLVVEVIICSTRASTPEGVAAISEWLRRWGLPVDVQAQIRVTNGKPPAIVYLDDRAMTFTGTWPSLQSLLDFRPWNRPAQAAVEALARHLHEAGRAAVEAGLVVNKVPGQPFLGWDEIADEAREGRRVQARYLLERGLIRTEALG